MASIKKLDERRYKITVSNGYRPNGKKISKAQTIQVPPGVPKRGIGQYVTHAAEELERDDLSDAARARLEAKLVSAPQQAQAAFDQIVKGVKDRQFSGKRNIFKEGLMSSRLPNSATAVSRSSRKARMRAAPRPRS